MSDVRSTTDGRDRRVRSRVSNGSRLLPSCDGRSTWARIMRDTFSSLVAHCGGADVISETRRLASRRTSVLESELCFLEDKFAKLRAEGSEPDASTLDLYGRLADRQRRLSESLGWDRTPRDVTSDLSVYLAQNYRRDPPQEAMADAGAIVQPKPAHERSSEAPVAHDLSSVAGARS
jgi:hypothetical protein